MFRDGIQSPFIVIEKGSTPEAMEALRDRLADGTHAEHAHRATGQAGAIQQRAPSPERTATDKAITFVDMARKTDKQPHRQLGRGHREQVGHDGQPHTAARTRLNIEVVIPFQRTGNDAQLRTLR